MERGSVRDWQVKGREVCMGKQIEKAAANLVQNMEQVPKS